MSKLLLTFYGDDFTGSTDALEQLALAGIRTMLFIRPPTPGQLRKFPGLEAVGVAGMTRAMTPNAMERELRPVFKKLKSLGAPHVHYKVCSTFDSSPGIGSIGRAIDIGAEVFPATFVPVLAAAPSLGRYTIFGNHFASYGIGSAGSIHRLDRHPSISKHPVTPMTEADLRAHLSRQTKKRIALFDILKIAQPADKARATLKQILGEKPDVVLFDAIADEHVGRIGELLEDFESAKMPLFSVGSSGIEAAMAAQWRGSRHIMRRAGPAKQLLVGSGSCSPVTFGQIDWALKNGFVEVPLNPAAVNHAEIRRSATVATRQLQAGHSVIIHTARRGPDRRLEAKLRNNTADILGTALGKVLRDVVQRSGVRRLCVAGGDTSSYAARALGIEALKMIAPLTPGAPLCRAHAPDSPVDGCEVVFKGGQVGGEDYFVRVLKGK